MAAKGTTYLGFVVAHTHWDREWYATFEQYRLRLVRLVDRVLALLESDPHFRYFTLDGQSIVLEDYLAIRPENEARLRALVQTGRLLIGPWYVLPDEFLVSGEALIRNLQRGRRVAGALGPVMQVGYVPDPFGHVAQLPQILRGFGIDSFIFSRGLGDEGEMLGDVFNWEAPDGSRVLAVHQIAWAERNTGYLNASNLGYPSPWVPRTTAPDRALAVRQLRSLTAELRRYARTPYLLVNNGSDHLEPQPELPAIIELANGAFEGERLVQGEFSQYLNHVRAAAHGLGTWRGELRRSRYVPLLSGVLSARMYLKQENARTERLLQRWAEPFAALSAVEGAEYPAAFLAQAWRYLLSNHPHDSICGCSIDQVHADMLPRFSWAQQIGEQIVSEALDRLARSADSSVLPPGSLPLVVFNPLGSDRLDAQTLVVDLPGNLVGCDSYTVVSREGALLPCQVLSRRRYQRTQGAESAVVEQVTVSVPVRLPAMGYGLFGLSANRGPEPVRDFEETETQRVVSIENSVYRVSARDDGGLDIVHKPTGHTLAGAIVLADEADAGDEYTFAPLPGDIPLRPDEEPTKRIVASGPVTSALAIERRWALPRALSEDRRRRTPESAECGVRLRVTLADGSERVDVSVDFENAAADHRLRLLVPTGIRAGAVTASGHFAFVERPIALPDVQGWAEQPTGTNHHDGFVSVDDGRIGVALISDGLPEYEAVDESGRVTFALTLLRSVGWLSRDDISSRPGHAGPGFPTPGAQCLGTHSFRCALHIGAASALLVRTQRIADEHNTPARAAVLPLSSRTELSASAARHPSVLSFLSLAGDGLVLSAVKQSEDGCWLVVRVFNPTAESVSGTLRCYRPLKQAAELRLDETVLRPLLPRADGALSFEAPRGKILTFGLQLG